jgi:hypothetical protein
MALSSEAAAAKVGIDEDWWANNNNKPTFVEIPSTVNGKKQITRWWTSFWFNMPPGYTGYYVWGGSDPKHPAFDSLFDPTRSVAQQGGDGVFMRVKRNGTEPPYTAELVLEGLIPGNPSSHPGLGHYAVTAVGKDLGSLDPNVVLGIFTYQYGTGGGFNAHREMDMLETIAGYQQTGDSHNAQFAIQPASADRNGLVNGKRFTIPKGMQIITVYMRWTGTSASNRGVDYRIYAGEPSMQEMIDDKDAKKTLKDGFWKVLPGPSVPEHKNERMHFNFYVPGGRKGKGLPKSDQEVFMKHFQYSSP